MSSARSSALLGLLEQAREADLRTRIEWRDQIAAYGLDAVREIRPWVADPSTAQFAIRVIEKAAAKDQAARQLAIDVLRGVRGQSFSEAARGDAAEALKRLGANARPASAEPREKAPKGGSDPIPALVRGYAYRRRELRDAGLMGNLYSGISYPAHGEHVCLFSGGANSDSYGYRDMPSGDNRYRYFGEWRGNSDMSLTAGNSAVLERSPNLYLFISIGGGLHRFEGRFRALDHERVVAERDGAAGEAIVFTLERVADEVPLHI